MVKFAHQLVAKGCGAVAGCAMLARRPNGANAAQGRSFGQRELHNTMSFHVTGGHRMPDRHFLTGGDQAFGRGRRGAWVHGAARAGAAVAAVFAVAAALSLVAGCAAGQPPVALPRRADPALGSAAPAAASQTPRQRVIAAYNGYWRAYAQGMTSRSAAAARSILARYLTPGLIRGTVRSYRADWAAHDVAYGGAVTHVLSVRIAGRSALLHDCLDLSRFGVQNSRTGRVMPQSFGLPRLNFYISLVLAGGRWLISNMQPVVVPCEP
jgi:hypothetical protein